MITATIEAEMQRPPEDLFDLLADVDNEARWSPDFRGSERLTDGPLGVGTRWDARYKGLGEMRVELTEYDRPRRLRFTGLARTMEMDVSFRFTPSGAGAGAGTALVGDVQVRLRGPMRLLEPIVRPLFRREMAKRPAQIMRAFEGDAPPAVRPRRAAGASAPRTPPG